MSTPAIIPVQVNLAFTATITLVAANMPAGTVSWSTSDVTIATVSSGGLVTALSKAGSCTITATVGITTATCLVTVAAFPTIAAAPDWTKTTSQPG